MKVTVIIPVYNVEKYLVRCLESVINQTYTNLEIIIVNDGSTDNSKKIIEKYSVSDLRIRVINKKNGGLSSARNVGLSIASGEYVTFIDSDDWIHRNMIEDMVTLANKNNADIVSVDNIRVSDHKINNNFDIDYNKVVEKIYTKNVMEPLFKNFLSNFSWAKLYKLDLFKLNNIWFPEGRRYEDIATLYILLNNCNILVISNAKYYYYYVREGSIVSEKKISDVYDVLFFVKQMNNYKLKNYTIHWEFYKLAKLYGATSNLCKIENLSSFEYEKALNEIYIEVNKIIFFKYFFEFFKTKGFLKILLLKIKMAPLFIKLYQIINKKINKNL